MLLVFISSVTYSMLGEYILICQGFCSKCKSLVKCVLRKKDLYIYIYIYILWRVGCLPPYHHHPVPYSLPFTRLPTRVRRGTETARAGGEWWGTPEPNGASSPPLFKCRARLSSGDRSLPRAVHARWCLRGSRKGAYEGLPCRQRREPPDPRFGRNRIGVTAVGPVCRANQSRRAPWAKR